MNILDEKNKIINLSNSINLTNLHYCFLDATDADNADYYFNPLEILEESTCAGVVLLIDNQYELKLPMDVKIILGEDIADRFVFPVMSLNDRSSYFSVYLFNSLSSFLPKFKEIKIVDIIANKEMKWLMPPLKRNEFLAVPIDGMKNNECVFITKSKKAIYDLEIFDHL